MLSPNEEKILRMISEKFLTPKQIIKRMKCSRQYVYKVLKALRKKGFLGSGWLTKKRGGVTRGGIGKKSTKALNTENLGLLKQGKKLRLHAQAFRIEIIHARPKYAKVLKRSNMMVIDGNRVMLYPKVLVIYSGMSFIGDSTNECLSASLDYFGKLFGRLENDLGVLLVKDRKANSRQFRGHYSEVGNEFAKLRKGEKFVVKAEDGKPAYIVDNSFNLGEFEAVHPQTAKADMDKAQAFFMDIRANDFVLLSQLSKVVVQHGEALKILLETFNQNSGGGESFNNKNLKDYIG